MNDWTSGYVADIGYTYGYYTELNPLRIKLAFLNAGLVYPEVGTACELGFGQGVSVNLHAAASATVWFGTDFNPAQAGFAKHLARIAGSGAQLFGQSFAEFCTRADLPDFDYIAVHGIWSWISDENRTIIANFVRRKLKVGGVLYISYNTQPGWAAMVPMRDLLTEHSEVMGASGLGIVPRVDGALAFVEKLFETNPKYARANPEATGRIKKIKDLNRNYLAHEYFNRDWVPMPFSRMAQWLSPAKLNFACSANYLEHIAALNLTAEQQGLLREITDPHFSETVRDFMVNQQFRRDYWVRGARRLNALEQGESLRAQQVVLVKPRVDVSLKVSGSLGEAIMQEEVYNPILDLLSDHQPKTLGEIEAALKDLGIAFPQIMQAVMVLAGGGSLSAVQDTKIVSQERFQTDKINTFLCDKAQSSGDISYLASPLTGGGINVGRTHQIFLHARTRGQKLPEQCAQFAWSILAKQGQRVLKEGKALENEADSLAELTSEAKKFSEKNLPVLKALGIVGA